MMTTGMNATTRVDLHCHSIHSDGTMTPRELAQLLHAHGVAAAALTDHDTTDGLPEFRDALARHGIGGSSARLRHRPGRPGAAGLDARAPSGPPLTHPQHRGVDACMGLDPHAQR